MAITKLPRNAIADDAINASKIEDGTVAITEVSGTITNAKLKDGDIANSKLSNSTFTARGVSRALGDSFTLGVDVDWQSVKTGNTSMVASQGYFVDTSSSAISMTLPSSASTGDTIAIKDYAGTFASNNCTILRNGHNIQGTANDSLIKTNKASVVLVYADSTKGWLFTNEHNVANLGKALFTSATGGTVTESGDYKIHTFTGDGTFCVSAVGNGPGGTDSNPAGGPNTVSYLVLAGGGGSHNAPAANGAAAGGGGGGFREGRDIGPSYTASPLVNSSGLTITATSFPVTVGAGGSSGGGPAPNTSGNGTNSVFSTITSAGGGTGAGHSPAGGAGGSGGGGSSGGSSGGAGNTPPVSPSQGNNGGSGFPGAWAAGGGGGAGGAGGNGSGPPATGGNAGAGVTTHISGSPVGYAGGGAGRGDSGNGSYQTPFGGATPSSAAAANRGGGDTQGAGSGKGVVIIRYKFQ